MEKNPPEKYVLFLVLCINKVACGGYEVRISTNIFFCCCYIFFDTLKYLQDLHAVFFRRLGAAPRKDIRHIR